MPDRAAGLQVPTSRFINNAGIETSYNRCYAVKPTAVLQVALVLK
jgi:hypothetical protein